MNARRYIMWFLWLSCVAIFIFVLFPTTMVLTVYLRFKLDEYNFYIILFGIFCNMLFKDAKLLYLTYAVLPVLSFVLLPELRSTVVALGVAALWSVLTYAFDTIRGRI